MVMGRTMHGVAGLALLTLAGIGPASAHAHLASAVPAVDGTVRSAPAEVSLAFTEKLEETLSRIVVRDAAGRQVDKGDTHFVGRDPKSLAVGLGALVPGTYTVTWTARSVDTHQTTGTFTFIVKP
ncbi:copper resistance CopC family protein [Methylobacterium sp. ID0610]|uniref:copper resistance CopC family protein n=1 Tax=Methylobacterium carpenticola TaxID=3344827 RepID=UPI003691A91B